MKKFFRNNAKWLVLTLYFLVNGIIIFESTLSGGISSIRSNFVASIFGDIINVATPPREPDIIAAENVTFFTHDDNEINENETYFIPIGITRRIKPVFAPITTTDKSIVYQSSDEEIVRVTQGGYLEARKLGENILITVQITSTNKTFKFYVSVVPKAAPTDYFVKLRDDINNVPLFSSTSLETYIKYRDEYVDANTLFNHEYDLTKFNYYSENHSVATVNKYGVISTHSVGRTYVGINGNDDARFEIIVTGDAAVIADEISFPAITATPLAHYIYQETIITPNFLKNNLDIEKSTLTDSSLTFVSSNEAVASVRYSEEQSNYILYGTKLAGSAVIDVFLNSNFRLNEEYIPDFTFTLNVADVLPTALSLEKTNNTKEISVGQKRTIIAELGYDKENLPEGLIITNQEICYTSSNPQIATVSSSGTNGIVLAHKKGTVTINAQSLANPELTGEITFNIVDLPFINDHNYSDFHGFIRKAIGHFSLFFVNGLIGYFTFLLITKKEHKLVAPLSLSVGLFIAAISEFIQYFVPKRSGNFVDIAINFSGYFFATVLIFLIFFMYKRRKTKELFDSKS